MFKEIVSQISFSPVMIERLSEYARITRRRQHISGWALIIVGILLILQILVIIIPPQSGTLNRDSVTSPSDGFISAFLEESSEAPATHSVIKQLETFADELPTTSNTVAVSVYSALLLISTLTYLSFRQRSKEVRIIRTQLNTGGF